MARIWPIGSIMALGIAVLSTTALAPSALAQEEVLRDNQEASELRTDWVIGSTVSTPDGARVGTIDGLLLDEAEGRVTAAIVSVGGFLGFGAKQIAVEWNELQIDYDGHEIILPITTETAEAAPEFAFRDRQEPPAPPAADPMGGGGGMATPPAPAPAAQ